MNSLMLPLFHFLSMKYVKVKKSVYSQGISKIENNKQTNKPPI